MTKRFLFNWAVWIGLLAGLYCLVYVLITPLFSFGVLPVTFVAFPLYFIAGAKKEDLLGFLTSAAAGVAWGCLYLYLIGLLMGWGVPAAVAFGLVLFVCTAILCAFHFIVTSKVVFNKVPMIFGALACTFMQGDILVSPHKWWVLILTLCLGILLAFACQCGTLLMRPDGRWKFLSKADK